MITAIVEVQVLFAAPDVIFSKSTIESYGGFSFVANAVPQLLVSSVCPIDFECICRGAGGLGYIGCIGVAGNL